MVQSSLIQGRRLSRHRRRHARLCLQGLSIGIVLGVKAEYGDTASGIGIWRAGRLGWEHRTGGVVGVAR